MSEQHARHARSIDHSEAVDLRSNAPNARKRPRGRPFAKGNPGRPVGLRHRRTLIAQALLDGEAEIITRKCIDLALDGDPTALKLCMERLVPPRKELPIEFTMPPLQSSSDLTAAMAAILKAASQGKITLSQAVEFGKLLQLYGQTASFVGQTGTYDWQATLAAHDEALAEVDPLPTPEMPAPAAPVSDSPPQEQNGHASRIAPVSRIGLRRRLSVGY